MRCKPHHANSQARSNLPTAFIYSSKFSVWIRFHVPTAKSAIVIFQWLEYVSYSSSTAHSTGTDKTCKIAEKTEWKPGQSICRSLKQRLAAAGLASSARGTNGQLRLALSLSWLALSLGQNKDYFETIIFPKAKLFFFFACTWKTKSTAFDHK